MDPFNLSGDILDILRTNSVDMLDLDGLADLFDDWQAEGSLLVTAAGFRPRWSPNYDCFELQEARPI